MLYIVAEQGRKQLSIFMETGEVIRSDKSQGIVTWLRYLYLYNL